jgi:hypothetical protein
MSTLALDFLQICTLSGCKIHRYLILQNLQTLNSNFLIFVLQGKMPLLLLSEVIQSIVIMSQYFEDVTQYTWMYETLVDIPKSFDKEDEILWPHLIYGIFYSAAKLTLVLSFLLFHLKDLFQC